MVLEALACNYYSGRLLIIRYSYVDTLKEKYFMSVLYDSNLKNTHFKYLTKRDLSNVSFCLFNTNEQVNLLSYFIHTESKYCIHVK